MKAHVSLALVGAAFVVVGGTSIVHAQAQPTFTIDWHVISSGGTTLSTGNQLQSSLHREWNARTSGPRLFK